MSAANKMAIALFGLSLLMPARSSTLEFGFQSAIRNSYEVALVKIVRGQLLSDASGECGARYYGKVLKSYKGQNDGYLAFGSLDALKIGEKYLVLVGPRDNYIENRTGWLNFRMRAYDEPHRSRVMKQWQKCQKSLPEMMISVELGAFPVENPSELGYRTEAVKIPSLTIRLPRGTTCYVAMSVDQSDKGLDAVWIKLIEIDRIIFDSVKKIRSEGDEKFISSRDCITAGRG